MKIKDATGELVGTLRDEDNSPKMKKCLCCKPDDTHPEKIILPEEVIGEGILNPRSAEEPTVEETDADV